jgi:Cu2+-exporting ATPase
MMGDGVNDAAALARADVAISLAGATPLAQSSADVVLLDAGLDALPAAVVHARTTRRIMRQNLGWALAYNALAIPAAALGFVTPLVASAGMSLSSLVVVLNAARALRVASSDRRRSGRSRGLPAVTSH